MENSKEKVKFELIEQFFPCDCRTEGLMCSKIIDDDEKSIYLAMYRFGTYNEKPSIIERLKFCWWHLNTGSYYNDQIILTYDKAKKIGNWLIENSK
jgi:hypothetical protein